MSDEQTTGGGGFNSGASARDEGTALLRQGQFGEAAAALRRAVQADPADESAWRLLGGALASGGDPQGAVEAFGQAVALNPESAKNHYNVAVALQGTGQIVEARAAIAQALLLDPNYQQALERQQELNGLLSGGSPSPDETSASGSTGSFGASGGSAAAYDTPSSTPQEAPVLRPPVNPSVSRVPPPPPPGGYAPPPMGGGYGAQGDRPYAPDVPPPMLGQAYGAVAPPVNGTTILVLAILGLVCFQILSPIAWIMGNNAINTLNQYPYADQSQRGTVVAGRVIGIIGTVFLVLGVIFFIIAALAGSR